MTNRQKIAGPAACTRLLGLAALTVLLACAPVRPRPAGREAPPERPLRVMTFNIEWGGTHVSFDKVVEAIRLAAPDVVGVQEAEGNLERLAQALGWHANARNYVVSRYPLAEPPGAEGRYAYVVVAPGEVVAISNLHLPSDPYGPDAVRDGASPAEVLALERGARLPAIEDWLARLEPLVARDLPLVLTGDFNTPAHTDWVPGAVGSRPFLRYPLDWPVTRAVAAAGFRDAYRSVHPDPLTHPGLTWWARRPPLPDYAPGADDAEDRIDYVWVAGPVRVDAARIVGEPAGPGVDLAVATWPSDHRAVVADLRVRPAPAPALVTSERRVHRPGESIVLRYFTGRTGTRDIVLRGSGPDATPVFQRRVTGNGTLALAAAHWPNGEYRLQFAGDGGPVTTIWIQPADARPAVAIDGERFARGTPIPVSWRHGPGHRNDYLALLPAGAPPGYDDAVAWTYVDALPEGRLDFNAARTGPAWPLAAGRYTVRLFEDDGDALLAESPPFVVE